MEIAKQVFGITKSFPKTEQYSLTSQLNRSAISIPSNIAEGSARGTNKGFKQFLQIALGSGYELETQIILSHSLKYIDDKTYSKLIEDIQQLQKMTMGFIKTLQ